MNPGDDQQRRRKRSGLPRDETFKRGDPEIGAGEILIACS